MLLPHSQGHKPSSPKWLWYETLKTCLTCTMSWFNFDVLFSGMSFMKPGSSTAGQYRIFNSLLTCRFHYAKDPHVVTSTVLHTNWSGHMYEGHCVIRCRLVAENTIIHRVSWQPILSTIATKVPFSCHHGSLYPSVSLALIYVFTRFLLKSTLCLWIGQRLQPSSTSQRLAQYSCCPLIFCLW